METLRFPVHQVQSQTELVELMEKEDLKPGAQVNVITTGRDRSVLLFAILLLLAAEFFAYFYNKQQEEKRVAGRAHAASPVRQRNCRGVGM